MYMYIDSSLWKLLKTRPLNHKFVLFCAVSEFFMIECRSSMNLPVIKLFRHAQDYRLKARSDYRDSSKLPGDSVIMYQTFRDCPIYLYEQITPCITSEPHCAVACGRVASQVMLL